MVSVELVLLCCGRSLGSGSCNDSMAMNVFMTSSNSRNLEPPGHSMGLHRVSPAVVKSFPLFGNQIGLNVLCIRGGLLLSAAIKRIRTPPYKRTYYEIFDVNKCSPSLLHRAVVLPQEEEFMQTVVYNTPQAWQPGMCRYRSSSSNRR